MKIQLNRYSAICLVHSIFFHEKRYMEEMSRIYRYIVTLFQSEFFVAFQKVIKNHAYYTS